MLATAIRRCFYSSNVDSQQELINSKIFIRGLSFSTTQQTLASYFGKFGPVIKAQVSIDILSGLSRGFGFVTFEKEESVNLALSPSNKHEIDGRSCYVFRARSNLSDKTNPNKF